VAHDSGPTGGHLELPRTEDGYIASITRRGPDGEVAWQCLPPAGELDAWVRVTEDGDEVVASSWSGWQVRLSLTDGTEVGRRFTK
jgi:hypothetical protein